jgi:hypothetical protein
MTTSRIDIIMNIVDIASPIIHLLHREERLSVATAKHANSYYSLSDSEIMLASL